jgi:hypothetical protein
LACSSFFFFLINISACYIHAKTGPVHIYCAKPHNNNPAINHHEGQETSIERNSLRALLGLLGGSTTGLGGSALLLLLLGKLDGGGAGDGGGAEVGAVATLGGGVDDALVDLAAGGVGGEGRGHLGLGGLVAARGQLGGEADGVGGVGVDADGLVERYMLGYRYGSVVVWFGLYRRLLVDGLDAYLLVDKALPLAGVPVGQVERVAGQLDTTAILALGEVRVVAACVCKRSNQLMGSFNTPMRICSCCSCLSIRAQYVYSITLHMKALPPPPSRLLTSMTSPSTSSSRVYFLSWATYG